MGKNKHGPLSAIITNSKPARRLTTNQEIPGSTPGTFIFAKKLRIFSGPIFLLVILIENDLHKSHLERI